MGQNPLNSNQNSVQNEIKQMAEKELFHQKHNPFPWDKKQETLNIQTLPSDPQKKPNFIRNPFKKEDAKVVIVQNAEQNHFDIRNHIHPEKLVNPFSGKKLQIPQKIKEMSGKIEYQMGVVSKDINEKMDIFNKDMNKKMEEYANNVVKTLDQMEKFEYIDEYGYSIDDFSNESKIKFHKKELEEMGNIEQQIFLTTTMTKWVLKETFESIRKNGNKDVTKNYQDIIESQLESKRKYKEKLEDLQKQIEAAKTAKQKRLLEQMKKKELFDEWEAERKELLRQEDMWSIMSDLPDVLSLVPLHYLNEKIYQCPIQLDEDPGFDELKEIVIDRHLKDANQIKNQRSREIFMYLADAIDQNGSTMVDKFHSIYQFQVTDDHDVEFPFTMDFKNGKGDFYLGNPPAGSDGALACKIKMTEKDFHKLLDNEIGVKQAVMQRKLKIEGGVTGVNAAYKLLNEFLNPYLFDTWGEADKQEAQLSKKAKSSGPDEIYPKFETNPLNIGIEPNPSNWKDPWDVASLPQEY